MKTERKHEIAFLLLVEKMKERLGFHHGPGCFKDIKQELRFLLHLPSTEVDEFIQELKREQEAFERTCEVLGTERVLADLKRKYRR